MKTLLNKILNKSRVFKNDDQKNVYLKEIAKLYNKNTFRGVVVTIILYNVFNTMDYFTYPDHFNTLFTMRLIFTVLAFVLLFFLKKGSFAFNHYKFMGGIWVFLMVVPICLMIYMTEGSISPYYAGLLLTIVGFCQFLPYSSLEAALYCFITILFYTVASIANQTTPFDNATFYNNMLFIVSISIINSTTCYFFTRLRIKEFKKRYELKEMDRIKTEYYAKVNHEIRTPLAMIVSPIEKLIDKKETLSEKDKDYLLNVARNNSLRLFGVANDLLEMIRLDQARGGKNFRLIDLSMVVNGIIDSVEYMFKRQNHSFNYIKSKTPIIIKGSYKALEKILINLLSNASKFTPKGGNVAVKVGNDDKNACILVRDTGMGISRDNQACIFQNFKQTKESDIRKSQGLGLGLAIAKDLAQEMGGTIEVVSEVNAGSDFIVTLPLAIKEDKDKWKNGKDKQKASNGVYDNSLLTSVANKADIFKIGAVKELQEIMSDKKPNYKMLIIDDEPDMNDYLAQIFKSEYKLIRAVNGEQGIEKALKETPDIILLDLMLPDLNGIEACKKMRQEESLADAKIIVLTARGDEQFRIDAIAAGANDFIGKPFSDIEIITRISRIKKGIKRRKELKETLRRLKTTLKDLKDVQSKLVRDEKLKTLGVLSAGILHEMSNHLNYPRLYSYQLQNDLEADPKLKNKADAIYEGIVRVEDVMTGLRQFTSGAKTHASCFRLNEMVTQAEKITAKRAENIRIKNKIEKDYKVFGVAPEILNLFLNLFINSIDALSQANRKSPIIEISAFKKDKRLCISFKDNGCGIPQKNINNIFEAFYTTKPSEKGMGLGLSIAEATIKRHKGEIKANSKQGEFTEFIFDLPLQD